MGYAEQQAYAQAAEYQANQARQRAEYERELAKAQARMVQTRNGGTILDLEEKSPGHWEIY
jgi:hypothetical protein